MYSGKVLDHFHNPRHVGEIENPTAFVEATNPVCGDVMKLWIVVLDGRITEATFKVAGCVPAVACGSWLTEWLSGRALNDLPSLSSIEIESALGGLPPASRHAAVLAVGLLNRLLEELK